VKSTHAGAVPAYAALKSIATLITPRRHAGKTGGAPGSLKTVKTLQTPRLRMVPVTTANAGMLWDLLQQPDLRSYQDLPDVDRAAFLRLVGARPTRFAPDAVGRFEWLLHARLDAKPPLGWVSLRIAEAGRAIAEIGYSVVREHRGKGIATEAVAALVAEGFRSGRLREMRAYCLPENLSSRAVLRHNGFDEEGTLPRGATVAGKPVDVILYCLPYERWTSQVTANREATRS
jgi:[ribosomal protein S5]-alanine N-acetyltransferase